jgi:hypothetical protein
VVKRSAVVVSFIVLSVLAWAPGSARADIVAAPRGSSHAAVAVGTSFVVEPPMADYVHELGAREQAEQARDWAVVGTLSRLGATALQLAQATYQAPPARLAYLDELYAFEYGRGRRAYFGNRVLLFRDRTDPDPQVTIGRLADRVRMESGEVPRSVELYVIDDQRDQGVIGIERAADLTRDELFSPAYGYVEREVHDLDELAAWLAAVDDLTSTRPTSHGLVLGGRRFAGNRTAGLDIDDVAAIYQAHQLLAQRKADALAELRALPRVVRDPILRYVDAAGTPNAPAALRGAEHALRLLLPLQRDRAVTAIGFAANKAPAPGFSLDPAWLPDPDDASHPRLLSRLRAFADDPCAELTRIAAQAVALAAQEPDESRRTSRTALAQRLRRRVLEEGLAHADPEVCEELKTELASELGRLTSAIEDATPQQWDNALLKYYEFKKMTQVFSALGLTSSTTTLAVLDFYESDTRVQCARYEGLAGTRVGMTLFYTDLLAKLWESTDFGHSAPIAEVPGFLSSPQIDLSPELQEEIAANSDTRIWFGAQASGVSRTSRVAHPGLLFDHRLSRVYAAGSDPSNPGVESQPAEDSRRTLGWWDRHFEDIADYEQEYHRQNQIMKWSLVTATLVDSDLGGALGRVTVSRDEQFTSWHQANRARLRFSETLPRVTQSITGRECIPLLSSYPFHSLGVDENVIVGGVTTPGRAAALHVPVADVARPLGARTAAAADLGAGRAGTATRAQATLRGQTVTFENAAVARTRAATGDVALGTPRVSFARGPAPGSVVIRAGEGKLTIGELEADVTANDNVALRWGDGTVERARLGKPARNGNTLETADQLAARGDAVDAARIYERGLPADLPDPDREARDVVVDLAHRRSAAVVAKLDRLAAAGKQLSPDAREALIGSVRRESVAVAQRFEQALASGEHLRTAHFAVGTERGRVVSMREIEVLSRAPVPVDPPAGGTLYIDTRLRMAQEGVLPDTGDQVARWTHVRGVKVSQLKADEIGALPDELIETSTHMTAIRAPSAEPASAHHAPSPVFLIQQCDATHATVRTSDDC